MKFSIKKGKHFSNRFKFGLSFNKKLMFAAKFNPNCLYSIEGADGQDINKLYGLSDDWDHMKNSIRIGWRCLDNKEIELFYFAHLDGQMKYEKIISVKPNEVFYVKILILDKKYSVDVRYNNKNYSKDIKRVSKWNLLPRYYLKFYFGGNEVAPHNMSVEINDVSRCKILI